MILAFAIMAGATRHRPGDAAPPPPPPPPLDAPILSGTLSFVVDPLTWNATTAYNADIPAQHYWAITPTGVEPTAAEIVAGISAVATGNYAAAAGSIVADWAMPAGIFETDAVISITARQLPDGPLSNVLRATGVDIDTRPGVEFREAWAGFAAGEGTTELLATGWTQSSTAGADVAFQTDAAAPNGVRCSVVAASNLRAIWRDDIAAALALGGFASVEVLIRLRAPSITGRRSGFGFIHSTTATGLSIRRLSGGTSYGLIMRQDPDGATGAALATGVASDALHWCRMRFDNDTRLRGKLWTGALGDEPTTWGAEVTFTGGTWPDDLRNLGMIPRSGGDCALILGFSVGIDRAAPDFY